MKNYVYLVFCYFVVGIGQTVGQTSESDNPLVVEELKGSDCLKAIIDMEGFLIKDDTDNPNTHEHLSYVLDIKAIEKSFPYMVEGVADSKRIKYEMLIPVLVEAVEEASDLLQEERDTRAKLEHDFGNYKITMQNELQAIYYEVERLKSEMSGLNESMSIDK